MKIKYLLPAILLFTLGLNNIFAQYTIEWHLPFSVYRLVYNFTLDTAADEVNVNLKIPESVIDQYFQYLQNRGINIYDYRDLMVPRVYAVIITPPSGGFGPPTISNYFVQDNVTCVATYRYYCNNFTVHLTNISAGTHYIVVYLPAFLWEDFEDNTLGTVVSNVGSCIDGEWCVERVFTYPYGYVRTEIISGGWDPTPNKALQITMTYGYGMLVSKSINFPIKEFPPTFLEADIDFNTINVAFVVGFELTDGSTVALRYGTWDVPGVPPICGRLSLSSGHIKIDLLRTLWYYCRIPANKVAKITKIYVAAAGYHPDQTWLRIDNIKLLPSFLYT